MKIQDLPLRPHNEGFIFVNIGEGDGAHFEVTQTHHEGPVTATTPLLMQHPIVGKLHKEGAMRTIPIRVLYDTPESNMGGRYEAWSSNFEGGPVCIGDGANAKAYDSSVGAWAAIPCRGPALCSRANGSDVACGFKARMQVEIELDAVPSMTFELRTSSFNTYQSILGTLKQLAAQHGSLRKLPLRLSTWLKSTKSSDYVPFGCAKVELCGVVPANGPQLSEAWETLGSSAMEAWLQECVPTLDEMKPANPCNIPEMIKVDRKTSTKDRHPPSSSGASIFELAILANQVNQSDLH